MSKFRRNWWQSASLRSAVFIAAFTATTVVPTNAQPEQVGDVQPSGSATAQPGVAYPAHGVAHPVRPGRIPKPEKDALPIEEPTPEEKSRLDEMRLDFDPRTRIVQYIGSLKFPPDRPILRRGRILFLSNPVLKKAYPDSVFYVLRFPQWPVALEPPQPLGNNNLFVISKESKALSLVLTDVERDSLKHFLMASLKASSNQDATQAVEAGLALGQELVQDGMFKFELDPSSLKCKKDGESLRASGRVNIVPQGGNSGTFDLDMQFDAKGKLIDCTQTVGINAGMRPICQSTKLLDSDPIVRKMAEQDLLIMGSSAKEYLEWQRTQVSPELKMEIDRIWRRILKERR